MPKNETNIFNLQTKMANPFSNPSPAGSAPPPIPARGGGAAAPTPGESPGGPERTLLIKQEAFVYKIPPQV